MNRRSFTNASTLLVVDSGRLQWRAALFVLGLFATGCGQSPPPPKPVETTKPDVAATSSVLPNVATPGSQAADAKPLSENAFLNDDALGLIVVHPKRIAESELYGALKELGLLEGIEAVVTCGLGPSSIERTLIVLDQKDIDFAEASFLKSKAESDERTEKYLLGSLKDAFGKLIEKKLPYPRANGDAEGKQTGLSWRVHLLPALGYEELYDQFHLDEPWDSEHNQTLVDKMPFEFTSYDVREPGKTSIHVFVGKDTPFSGEVGARFKDFTDDPSKTILVIAAGKSTAVPWTKPGGLAFNADSPKESLGDVQSTFRVISANGDVLTLPRSIDDRSLANMIQWNDGNEIELVEPEKVPQQSHIPTLILKLASKVDRQSFFTQFQGGSFQEQQDEAFEGQSLRFSEGSAVCAIDDTIVLSGPIESVKSLIRASKSGRKEPSLLLSNLKPDADAVLWLDMRGQVAALRQPKESGVIHEIAEQVESISLRLNLAENSGADFIEMKLTAVSEPVAKEIKQEAANSLAGIMAQFGIALYFEEDVGRSIGAVLASLSVDQIQNQVALKIPKTEDFKKHRTVIESGLKQQARANAVFRVLLKIRHLGLAMQNYAVNHGKFPVAGRESGLSWRVHLLPLMGYNDLYEQFNLDEPWDSQTNKPLIDKMPDEFRTDDVREKGKTSIHVFTGPGAPFEKDEPIEFMSFTDGVSSTILLVHGGADTAEVWTRPGGLDFDPKNPIASLGKIGDTFQVVLVDGSARRLPRTINPEQLRRLIQHQDGEEIDPF